MHEITLSQRALEIIEQQAQQAGARRVTGVWLKVGAFSCVEASALTFCFELVCRGTLAEGCELHIAEQQAECWCDRCQQYVHLVSQHVRRCPHCNNDQLQIVADDGLQIQRLNWSKLCVQHAAVAKATSILKETNETRIPRSAAPPSRPPHARR